MCKNNTFNQNTVINPNGNELLVCRKQKTRPSCFLGAVKRYLSQVAVNPILPRKYLKIKMTAWHDLSERNECHVRELKFFFFILHMGIRWKMSPAYPQTVAALPSCSHLPFEY